MGYRYVDVNKLKSKKKKNQYINDLIDYYSQELLISKMEYKKRHKQEIIEMFDRFGWNDTANMYVCDCLGSAYWYKDPICYKTSLDNINMLDFNGEFIRIFGEEILKNKTFLKKMKAINNFNINSSYKIKCK